MQERQFVERVLAGDPSAERDLYDTHVDRVFRLAYRMTGDEPAARECTQDTFVRAFEWLATFRGDAALSTWLHTITMSVTLNWHRKIKRMHTRELELTAAERIGSTPIDAEPDLRDRLAGAVDALSAAYKAVVVMHDIEGYTHEEIGRMLGIPAGTSKARLSRARSKLRTALADFAGEWAS